MSLVEVLSPMIKTISSYLVHLASRPSLSNLFCTSNQDGMEVCSQDRRLLIFSP